MTSVQRPPVYNGHYFGVSREVVVNWFDCTFFKLRWCLFYLILNSVYYIDPQKKFHRIDLQKWSFLSRTRDIFNWQSFLGIKSRSNVRSPKKSLKLFYLILAKKKCSNFLQTCSSTHTHTHTHTPTHTQTFQRVPKIVWPSIHLLFCLDLLNHTSSILKFSSTVNKIEPKTKLVTLNSFSSIG